MYRPNYNKHVYTHLHCKTFKDMIVQILINIYNQAKVLYTVGLKV